MPLTDEIETKEITKYVVDKSISEFFLKRKIGERYIEITLAPENKIVVLEAMLNYLNYNHHYIISQIYKDSENNMKIEFKKLTSNLLFKLNKIMSTETVNSIEVILDDSFLDCLFEQKIGMKYIEITLSKKNKLNILELMFKYLNRQHKYVLDLIYTDLKGDLQLEFKLVEE